MEAMNPTTEQIWFQLQKMYGKELQAASLTLLLLKEDGTVKMINMFVPQTEEKK